MASSSPRSARQLLRAEFGEATNFMTSDVTEIGWLGATEAGSRYAYEISEGDFLDDHLYGLSIVRERPDGTTERCTQTSKVFHALAPLRHYLGGLRERLNAGEELT